MDKTKELQVSSTTAIAQDYGYQRKDIELMKDTIAKGATDEELRFFLQVAKHSGMDPFAKQIYMVKRWSGGKEQMTVQMGIDGFRAQAQATGEYNGSDDPEFGPIEESEYKTTKESGKFKHPAWAKVAVWGKGDERPTVSTAYWEEFYPGDAQGHMWRKMPRQMLSKVAESQSLRKRFPKALSGIYTTEEMAQANTEDVDAYKGQEEKQEAVTFNQDGNALASQNQIKILYTNATNKGYAREDVHKIIKTKYGVESTKDLTRDQAEECVLGFQNGKAKGEVQTTKMIDEAMQSEMDEIEGEVMAAKVPASGKSKLTEEEELALESEIADIKAKREEG